MTCAIVLIVDYSGSDLPAEPWADPEGGKGVGTPLKNHKNIGFLSNTGPEPL